MASLLLSRGPQLVRVAAGVASRPSLPCEWAVEALVSVVCLFASSKGGLGRREREEKPVIRIGVPVGAGRGVSLNHCSRTACSDAPSAPSSRTQVQIDEQVVDLEKGVTLPAAMRKKPLTFWSSRKEMEESFSWRGDEGKQV